jgi:hypothetical protein
MIHKMLSAWDTKLLHVNKQEENTVLFQSICSCLKYVGTVTYVYISTVSTPRELNVGELNFVLGSKIKVAGKFQ